MVILKHWRPLKGYWVRTTVYVIIFCNSITLAGQKLPGNAKASSLPDQINSQYEESKPITTVSGDTLYFVRSHHPDNTGGEDSGSDIWVSYRNSVGEWSMASNSLAFLNTAAPDQVIGFSTKGSVLYTLNYIIKGSKRYAQIMQSQRHATNWGLPTAVEIDPILLPDGYHEFYMHPSGEVLLISMRGIDSIGEEDLYLSKFEDSVGWSKPQNLGIAINTQRFEISPFLSDDMTRLYFASSGLGGFGNSDIWVSERLGASLLDWSTPTNMGEEINSKYFDAFYFKNQQGEIYFSSNRNHTHANIFNMEFSESAGKTDTSLTKMNINSTIEHTETQSLVLFFDLDEAELNRPQLIKLEDFCNSLSKAQIQRIVISGYTDHTGNSKYNMDLSQRRALNTGAIIKRILAKEDSEIPLLTYGKGIYAVETNPHKMRRVEISVISGNGSEVSD